MTKAPLRRTKRSTGVESMAKLNLSDLIVLTTIDLFRAELKFLAPEPGSSLERGELDYRCVVPIFRKGIGSDILIVNFMVSRSQSRAGGEDIDLSYVCVFRRAESSHTEDQIKEFYSHFIRNSVWQKGRDLVLTFVSQGNFDLTTPPVVMPSLEWKNILRENVAS